MVARRLAARPHFDDPPRAAQVGRAGDERLRCTRRGSGRGARRRTRRAACAPPGSRTPWRRVAPPSRENLPEAPSHGARSRSHRPAPDPHPRRSSRRAPGRRGPSPRSTRSRSTSNNVTYGVFGDALQYWNFFPRRRELGTRARVGLRRGRRVRRRASSRSGAACTATSRWPPSSSSSPAASTRAASATWRAHRQPMAAAYSRYLFTDADPVLRCGPRSRTRWCCGRLFFTSFVIDDFIADNDMFGASTVVVSSASSKTAIGAALPARERGKVCASSASPRPGIPTSSRSLGCYHDTVTYDDVSTHRRRRRGVRRHRGQRRRAQRRARALRRPAAAQHGRRQHPLGPRDRDAAPAGRPDTASSSSRRRRSRSARRSGDKPVLDERVGEAWDRFSKWVDGWLTFEQCNGPEEVEAAYRTLLEGRADPRVGYVCSMQG